MAQREDRHNSPWVATMSRPDLGDTGFRQGRHDVLVLGAGVTGLTTALELQAAGRDVAVVEARRLGQSVTAHSTVKVTIGHGTVYSRITRLRGAAAATTYAHASLAGFERVLSLAGEVATDVLLEHGGPHVVYAETAQEVQKIEKEAEAVRRIGLSVSLDREVPLPFEVAGALHFPAQASLHPGLYLAGLAQLFVARGGILMEGVRATGVAERSTGCRVETTAGPIQADHVVVATHYPFLDRGGQFSQLKPRRSYGIAGVLPTGTTAGMTINVGSPTHSTRTASLEGETLLIVVGEGHPVGHVQETAERWARLRTWATERFGVREFRYHWSAEELASLDGIPFVGRIWPGSSRILTATGYDGWGMTNGTAAALMLRDIVVGRDNPWLPTFDARRAEARLPPVVDFAKQNLHVAKTWLADRVGGRPRGSADQLDSGEAAVLEIDGKQTAAYRDEAGQLHAVSAVCTHLGCTVRWNAGERSWDCPCHGSRFDPDGGVLHGPAVTPLAYRDLDSPSDGVTAS
jgi:glycine/D-amino acid oxidase-like deaminating enzyme/nitrite reductase/ring-hydroxylating ferredoxin subunit